MAKERTQLNINIDPKLLVKLKSESIKNGKTLTEFVTEKLASISTDSTSSSQDSLEQRLTKIENHLNLNNKSYASEKSIGAIFTDEGAKEYGDVSKKLFELHLKKKKLSIGDGLKELSTYLDKLPNSNPELVYQILLGTHALTGKEMTIAYRHGSCAMRTALIEFCNDPLEELNTAFLKAVISKSLV